MEERRNTSANTAASNYAPRVFAKMTLARGVTDKQLEAAMNRLFHLEIIRNDEKLWKRENRTWVTGIKQVQGCTNPRTNPAQSPAQSVPQAAQSYTTDPHTRRTPSTTYIGQAPDGPAQSMYDDEPDIGEPPPWMDEARAHDPDWMDNPVLNRDFGKGE